MISFRVRLHSWINEPANIIGCNFLFWNVYIIHGDAAMIVVSNRVHVPEDRVETFVDRLRTSHGIEEQPGFRGLKLSSPVDAAGHITMKLWNSPEDYENWRDGNAFEQAYDGSSTDKTFESPNEVEIHEVIVQREPGDSMIESQLD
jgi:heme-degrading monooxygenase HmoA